MKRIYIEGFDNSMIADLVLELTKAGLAFTMHLHGQYDAHDYIEITGY